MGTWRELEPSITHCPIRHGQNISDSFSSHRRGEERRPMRSFHVRSPSGTHQADKMDWFLSWRGQTKLLRMRREGERQTLTKDKTAYKFAG